MKMNHRRTQTGITNACHGRARCPQRAAALISAFFALAFSAFAADPAISVSAKQRYPWNGLVDVQFMVVGQQYNVSLIAKDVAGGTNLNMQTVYKADGTVANVNGETLTPGTYNWVWNAAADLPKDWKCDRVVIEVNAE